MTDAEISALVAALNARGLHGEFATYGGIPVVTITDSATGKRVTLLSLEDLAKQILAGEISVAEAAKTQRRNSYARRNLRDTADEDYVMARCAFQAGLYRQFRWSALQALEKYLKAICLFRSVGSHDFNHDLQRTLKAVEQSGTLDLSKPAMEFIAACDGADRYREYSFVVWAKDLLLLDRTVWEIRPFCGPGGKAPSGHRDTKNGVPTVVRIEGGLLEKIIDSRKPKEHPARRFLVHRNGFFCVRPRKTVKVAAWFLPYTENSDLSNNPELLDELEPYIKFSKDAKTVFREALNQRKAKAGAKQ